METLAAIIAWAVFGLIIGAVARLLVPGRQPMGIFMTMLLGVVGSLAGGMISWIFRGGEPNVYEPAGWIMSTIGAVIVVLLFLRIGRRTE
jgi:uncharacterized membrane protein YeaQ/YmgE (transglycosylase-associated protein family)